MKNNVRGRGINMVKVELSYNPYLFETIIKFNGKEPRINSLVEKFSSKPLQYWIGRIPKIFYDEMNGYDFVLEFSGTKLDFEELCKSFELAGVSKEKVYLFHKNELESRESVIQKIDQLIKYLDDNPNKNFDYKSYREKNRDIFDHSYTYIVFQGDGINVPDLSEKDISIENISDFKELYSTNLENVPILFYVGNHNMDLLQDYIHEFVDRPDVYDYQLFFMIDPSLNRIKIERTIKDLGIRNLQIVSSFDDDLIMKYIELLPMNKFIYTFIKEMRNNTSKISNRLNELTEKSSKENREIYETLEKLENNVSNLKIAAKEFENQDNMDIPFPWKELKHNLLDSVSNWNRRKTKVNDVSVAKQMALTFESDLRNALSDFSKLLWNEVYKTKTLYEATYIGWYISANVDCKFRVEDVKYCDPFFSKSVNIANDLRNLKHEQYVHPKEDLLKNLFKGNSQEKKELVLETVYYFQEWRELAIQVMEGKSNEIINTFFTSIVTYNKELSAAYLKHINELIFKLTMVKEIESSKLSVEEKKIQDDNEWFIKLQDLLAEIERG